jgi:hypothetical protein
MEMTILDIKKVERDPLPDELLQRSLEEVGIETIYDGKGRIARPTAGAISGDFGVPMYLGITKELESELGIAQGRLTEHVAITLIDGSKPSRFRVYLLSAVIDDERFRLNASKGLYECYDIDAAQAEKIIANNPVHKNSISLPSGNMGKEESYAILLPQKIEGKLLPTTLRVGDYESYSSTLRKGKDGKSGWEAANLKGLPIVVVPNGVAKLLGHTLENSTNLVTEGKDKTIVAGSVCNLKYSDGKVQEIFVVGARDHLGISKELQEKIGLQVGREYNFVISVGQKELIVEQEVERIADTSRFQVDTATRSEN